MHNFLRIFYFLIRIQGHGLCLGVTFLGEEVPLFEILGHDMRVAPTFADPLFQKVLTLVAADQLQFLDELGRI